MQRKLNQLPWWPSVKNLCSHYEHFNNFLKVDKLVERVEQFPPSKDLMVDFENNYLSSIWVMSGRNPKGKIYRDYPYGENLHFLMPLSSYYPFKEMVSTFIHEILHTIYGVTSFKFSENLILQEEEKFFEANKEFSLNLFNRSLGRYKGELSRNRYEYNIGLIDEV